MEPNWSQKDVEEENGIQCKIVEDTNNDFMKHSQRGGWKSFPFILGSMLGQTLASGGWMGNLIVYLITKYNVKSIDATQVNNVVLGCFSFFPILGAIISDSFYGSFPVITFFSFVSLLGVTLMTLTAALHSLRPPPCLNPLQSCDQSPSKLQYGVLYMALGLACIGFGGTRFTTTTMGADQFEDFKDRGIYFNWYFCFFYVGLMISSTAIIYVQDNVSWTVGFGICVATNAIAVILFLFGNNLYRHIKPKGSPFTSIARVIVAAVKKRRVYSRTQEYYNYDDTSTTTPSDSFRFLNRGALKMESDGPKSRSWSLCTVQEVEDLKTLIRIMPLWSSGILLSTLIGMFGNFTLLQALTMDRHLGHGSHFKIPAASLLFFNTLATSISLLILDRLIFPMWQNLIGSSITPLQRIGVGHVVNFVALASSALIEVQRLKVARAHHSSMGATTIVPFSAFWLVVPLTILGIGEAFHFPGQILLYYQEFPTSLHNTSTAMMSLLIAIGFYLSTGITSLIRRNTGWLMDDIDDGRLDLVYWMLVAIGLVNFVYFLICVKMYRHKLDKNDDSVTIVSSS